MIKYQVVAIITLSKICAGQKKSDVGSYSSDESRKKNRGLRNLTSSLIERVL